MLSTSSWVIPITSRVVRGECACLYGVVTFSSGGTAVWGLALENDKTCQQNMQTILVSKTSAKFDQRFILEFIHALDFVVIQGEFHIWCTRFLLLL